MIFRACERFGIKPWDFPELGLQQRLDLLNYDAIASHDANDLQQQLAQLGRV